MRILLARASRGRSESNNSNLQNPIEQMTKEEEQELIEAIATLERKNGATYGPREETEYLAFFPEDRQIVQARSIS